MDKVQLRVCAEIPYKGIRTVQNGVAKVRIEAAQADFALLWQ